MIKITHLILYTGKPLLVCLNISDIKFPRTDFH